MVKSLGTVLFVALVLSGCSKVTEVQVTSEASQLLPGGTTKLTATVLGEGPFDPEVTWSASVEGVGSLSATTGEEVTYTAPDAVSEDTQITVTATSKQTPARSASVTLTLLAAPSVTGVQVTAVDSELFAEESVTLEASVTGNSSFSSEVTWSVEGGGSLSATTGSQVIYTAPDVVSADTPVTVTATSVQTPSRSASATLTLKAPSISAVQVVAARTALVEKENVELEALVSGAGPFSSEVSWSVQGDGSLSATTGARIVYTSPDSVPVDTQVTVTATSVADGSKVGSITLMLYAPAISAVQLAVARAQLYSGNAVVFSATVSGTAPFSSNVEWKLVSGGGLLEPLPVDSSRPTVRFARYTAPATTQVLTATVQATSAADPTKFDSKSVQVLPVPLSITEVSSSTNSNRPGWLELRNNTSEPIQLADYALRARGFDISTNAWVYKDVMLFPLPTRLLAPGAYMIVSGKAYPSENFDSSQMIWLREEPALIPVWSGTTFIELVRRDIGETVDFVRFGTNNPQAPLSEGAWTGTANVAAVPTDGSSAFSFVRTPGAKDTNSASDWSSRPFSTPGGPNDVPAGAVDDDSDGIPDSAEVAGGRFAGLNLYAMGARTAQRDIFIEVDHMKSTDPVVLPQKEALDKLVAVFDKRGIKVHLDVGTRFSPSFDLAKYNLGQGSPELPQATSINLTRNQGEAAGVYELKATHMDFARRSVFHYAVFGSTQNVNGTAGASGNAERPGNDLLVTLVGFKLSTDTVAQRNQIINYQAAVLMHELGHNFGLRHGGNVDTNLKPNYLSVMNPLYELEGLGPISGSSAGDRYYLRWRMKGYDGVDDLANSPLSTTFVLDYSDGSGGTLNETVLAESAGMCRPGSTSIDYDNGGFINTPAFDVNRDTVFEVLSDHNDWANIVLPFALSHGVVRN